MKEKIKLLASDTKIYGFFRFLGRFISFLLVALYSNAIEVTDFAFLTYLFSLIAFLNVIYSFGMESAFFRFFKKNQPEQSRNVFSHSYLSIMLISFTISALAIIFSKQLDMLIPTGGVDNSEMLIKLAFIIPFLDGLMLIPNAYLRMIRKARRFAMIQFSVVVIAVVLNIVLITQFAMGAEGALVAQFIASFIGVMLLMPELSKNFSFKFDKPLFKEMLRFGLPTIPASIAAIILQVADRQIFAFVTGDEMPVGLAVYGAMYRLGIPMMIFVSVFDYAWKPFYLSNYEDKDAKRLYARILTYFTAISAVIFLLGSFYMEFVVRTPIFGYRFIHERYWEGLGIVPIILAAYYFNGMFYNFAAGFLIRKKTKYIPIAVGAGAVLNVGLNIWLIPKISYWGAAWATFAAYLLVAIISYLLSRRIYPIAYEWKRLITLIAVSGAGYFASAILTTGMSLWSSFFTRTAIILFVMLALFVSKFFDKDEIREIKRLLSRFSKKKT